MNSVVEASSPEKLVWDVVGCWIRLVHQRSSSPCMSEAWEAGLSPACRVDPQFKRCGGANTEQACGDDSGAPS